MMILIGLGSILSLVECVLDTLVEKCKIFINSKMKEILLRFFVCVLFYLAGISMTFSVGFSKIQTVISCQKTKCALILNKKEWYLYSAFVGWIRHLPATNFSFS
jgi:hypothetical protein